MPRLMGVSHQAPLGVRVTKSEKGESLDGENYLLAFQGGIIQGKRERRAL